MIGERIRELRKKKGVTQEELAKIIGVERSSIGKYEGKQQIVPSDDVKIKLAEYFGVTLDYLCGVKAKENDDEEFRLDDIEKEIIIQYRRADLSLKQAVCDILHIDSQHFFQKKRVV